MISLRLRMAILLSAAIISVVALASIVAFTVVGIPGTHGWDDDVTRQIVAVTGTLPADPDGAFHLIRSQPAGGVPDEVATRLLRAHLALVGHPIEVVITRPVPDAGAVASVPIDATRWLIMGVAAPEAPRGGWGAFTGWMLLIMGGAIAISLFAAYVMTRPLALIEDAILRVGADATLPVLPETGPPEARAAASALNRLSARLRSAMDSRMRLIAAAGHDLRTPMTRMRLRVEFLAEDERAEWARDLDELDRIADSAIGLVREEVEGGTPKPVDVGALTRDVVTELNAIGHAVTLGPLASVEVRATPLALKRALRNLIINAATHGNGASVRAASAEGYVRIVIEDRGPGIPPELMDRVFEPFFRVDPARRQSMPGAGLGLAIAREIIARLGGTIAIANRRGGGLRQIVTLPV